LFYEPQSDGVHAIALVGRWGAVIKDMPKVTVAFAAQDFNAFHEQAGV
jgi:hypothetical protein